MLLVPIFCIVCLSCGDGFFLDNYEDSKTKGQCVLCPAGCKTCVNLTVCRSCNDGEGISADDKAKCVKCQDPNCASCAYEFDTCTKCKPSYGRDWPTTDECKPCSMENCEDCGVNMYTCVKCKDGYLLSDKKCEQKCPDNCKTCKYADTCQECMNGYKLNDDNSKCITHKIANCDKYLNENQCSKCENGYSLENNKCNKCPGDENCSPYYKYEENTCNCKQTCNIGYGLTSDKKCVKCTIPNCISCSFTESGEECTTCFDNSTKQEDGSCKKWPDENCAHVYNDVCFTCNIHYRLNQNKECEKCEDDLCNYCSKSTSICNGCISGYVVNRKTKSCVKAEIPNCEFYEYSDECIGCVSGYGLDKRYNTDTYKQCIKCSTEHCRKCDSNPAICTDCEINYYLEDNKCIKKSNVDDDNNGNNGDNNGNTNTGNGGNEGNDGNGENGGNGSGSSGGGKSGDGLPKGAIIGIAVGCAVVVVVVVVVIVVMVIRKKKDSKNKSSSEGGGAQEITDA